MVVNEELPRGRVFELYCSECPECYHRQIMWMVSEPTIEKCEECGLAYAADASVDAMEEARNVEMRSPKKSLMRDNPCASGQGGI